MSSTALWQRLVELGEVHGAAPEERAVPWSIRLMLGAGAWLGSMFALGLLAALSYQFLEHASGRLMVAAFAAGAAYLLFQAGLRNVFVSQLGLICGCIAQALVLWSIFDALRLGANAALAVFLLAILSLALPSRLWRVLSTWQALIALVWLTHELGVLYFLPLLTALCAVAGGLLFIEPKLALRRYELLRPLAFGLVLGAFGLSAWLLASMWVGVVAANSSTEPPIRAWLGLTSLLLGLSNAWLAWHFAKRHALANAGLACVLPLALAAATWSCPPLSAALGLVLLGYGRGEKALLAFGILGLICALGWHYYALSWPLDLKALSLVGAGVLLGASRAYLLKLPREVDHA